MEIPNHLLNLLFDFINHTQYDRFEFDLEHLRLLVDLGTHLDRLHDIRPDDLLDRQDLLDRLTDPDSKDEATEYLALLDRIAHV